MLELHESTGLFANFSSNPGSHEIRDRTTGALLGHADVDQGTDQIAFAGSSRKVVGATGQRIEVQSGPSDRPAELPRFPAKAAPVSGHLCGVVREHLGLGPGQVPCLRLPAGDLAHFWFLGSFEAKLAAQSLGLAGRATPILCSSHQRLSADDFAFSQDRMEDAAREIWTDLERLLKAGSPTFRNLVPDEARQEWVALSARRTRLWEWTSRVEVIEPGEDMASQLRLLL